MSKSKHNPWVGGGASGADLDACLDAERAEAAPPEPDVAAIKKIGGALILWLRREPAAVYDKIDALVTALVYLTKWWAMPGREDELMESIIAGYRDGMRDSPPVR